MSKTLILAIHCPSEVDDAQAVELVSEAIGDDQGHLDVDGGEISWNLINRDGAAPVDPRQLEAAGHLVMAFSLPQDLGAAAQSMLLASVVNPNAIVSQMGPNNQRDLLMRAKMLIEEVLNEAPVSAGA